MNLAMDDVEEDETRRMPPTRHLPHELFVSEILVRLPVESLMRFSCVCKAWRDTISGDTCFSEAHIRRHQPQKERPSSLLIAPCIKIENDGNNVDSMEFATPGLYLWEEKQRHDGVAALVHGMAWFPAAHWMQVRHGFAHCDGLVMLPDAHGTVHVLNPATRCRLTLPWSPNSTGHRRSLSEGPNALGFGRDPSSGAYKVARFFGHDPFSLGMEVFTVGEDRCWRETAAKPPYPLMEGRTATFFKGSLIWTVDLNKSRMYQYMYEAGVSSFVRFSLEDESFKGMPAPQWYFEPRYEKSRLAELHGKLALSRLNEESAEIWMCDDLNSPRWALHHVLNSPSYIHPIAEFHGGIVFRDGSYYLCHQTSEGAKHMVDMRTLKYRNRDTDTLVECSSATFHDFDVECSSPTFHDFDVIPYIPTLVPI